MLARLPLGFARFRSVALEMPVSVRWYRSSRDDDFLSAYLRQFRTWHRPKSSDPADSNINLYHMDTRIYIYIILYPPVVHPANYRAATTLSRMDLKSKNVKEQSVNETNQKVAVRNWEPWAVWKRFRLQCNESKLSHTGVTWISLQALKEDDAGILKELDVVRCEEASCSVHSDLWPLALTSLYVTHLLIYSSLGSASLLWDPAGNIVLLSSRRTWSTTRTTRRAARIWCCTRKVILVVLIVFSWHVLPQIPQIASVSTCSPVLLLRRFWNNLMPLHDELMSSPHLKTSVPYGLMFVNHLMLAEM